MRLVLVALSALLLPTLPLPARADPDLAGPAGALLASLPEAQREEATWAFDDSERSDVHYAPLWLEGVRHDALSEASRARAEELLAATLSEAGHARVHLVRALEHVVEAREAERFWGLATRWMRDPGRYLWAFFGQPRRDAPWGFRLEGHHLSLNVTAVPGRPPATTPLFLGAQPRVVPEGASPGPGMPPAGAAALGREEVLARELYASLDAEQRAAATLPWREGRGHMLGQVARLEPPAPAGVARAGLRPEQQALLDALADRFAALWSEPIAAARRAELAAAREGLHFAHVESSDPPHAWYTRLSGPGVLIEIDNTTDGDHVHAVWHRPGSDFGDDLLARHLRRHHGIRVARGGAGPAGASPVPPR